MKKKSTSQTEAKASWKNAILLAVTAALALFASSALAADTTWTNTVAGNWCDPGNWYPGSPVSGTNAFINNGGTAQIYTDACMAEALSLTLGQNADESGTVQVIPGFGDLTVGEAIFVGKGGNGTLTITQGTVISATASIASQTGSSGSATVDSRYSTWAVSGEANVGAGGKGSLSITNGGSVTASSVSIASQTGSNGSATVDGTGSTWAITGKCDVGGYNDNPGGTAFLSVANGGTVTAGSVYVYPSGTLTGNSTVSTINGTTTVDGTVSPNGGGGTLTLDGDLELNGGATTQCNVTPQDNATNPQIGVSGQVSLDGRLSITMTGDFSSAPTRYTLLQANSVDIAHPKFGSYSIKYPTANGWTPQISYVSNDVYLDRVYNVNP